MFKINVSSEMHALFLTAVALQLLQSCGGSVSLPLSLHPNKSSTVDLLAVLEGHVLAAVQEICMKFSFVVWVKLLPSSSPSQYFQRCVASAEHFHAPLHFRGKEDCF